MAEILGGAIALQMLLAFRCRLGSMMILVLVLICEFTSAYKRIEKLIIVFVSLIGFSFLFEVWIADIDWARAAVGWVKPSFPKHSMPVILSVLGAVVMPHNLFLHSEIIQSRQWNLEDGAVIARQLKYEFKRYPVFYDDRLGHQQCDDSDGGRNLFSAAECKTGG